MTRSTAALAVALAVVGLPACAAPAPASTLFPQVWNAGVSPDEPAYQVQPLGKDTFVIRQSIRWTFEAPFLYLIVGREKALLIDTGVTGSPLREVVDRLLAGRSVSLVVMHSHGHGDHVGGDAALAARPGTVVVGHKPEEVAAFFGLKAWPEGSAAFDLGGRTIDVVPTPGHHPSHVMVFDRATRNLFSGDAVYPGKLYFQCGKASEYAASIRRAANFAAANRVRWVLGGHIEMKAAPGAAFEAEDRARRDEHLLELPPSVLGQIQAALAKMGDRVRVEAHDDFILFPHPADPRGKSPPDWCLAQEPK